MEGDIATNFIYDNKTKVILSDEDMAALTNHSYTRA